MKHLINKKDPSKVLILCMDEDDCAVINILWKHSMIFGAYNRVDMSKMTEENPSYPKFVGIIKQYPSVKEIIFVNLVDPFKDGEDNEKPL